jgi:DNA polymerase epsilon subunit 2
MPVSRQQIIIRVFRKYSHSLGPEELEYLDDILKEHEISDEDIEMSIELIAKEYNKQDGSSLVSHLGLGGLTPTFSPERCYHEGLG